MAEKITRFTALEQEIATLKNSGSGVPATRTLSINGQSYDLSQNRSWTVSSGTDASALSSGTIPDGRINTNISRTLSLAALRANTSPQVGQTFYTTDKGKEGYWYYDSSDTTSADNTGTVLVAGTKRYKRMFIGPVYASWFNLVGDGVTNIATALSAIFTALPARSTVIFTDLNYLVNGEIILAKAVNLIGLGNVKFTQGTDYTNIFRCTVPNINFANLTFQQTGKGDQNSYPTGYGAGIVYYRTTLGQVLNCSFYNCGDHLTPLTASPRGGNRSGAAVYITIASDIKVDGCRFYNCIQGVNVDSYQNPVVADPGHLYVSRNFVTYSHFEDCFKGVCWDFLDASGGRGNDPGSITNCTFIKTSAYATAATQAINLNLNFCTSSLLIDQCRIDGLATGIGVLYGSYYTTISNCDIKNCYDGISLFTGAGQVVHYITIDNTTITGCTNTGIVGSGAYDCQISNCKISLNKIGILSGDFCVNFNLNDNYIFSNTYVGVQVDSAIGMKIEGGAIYNNGTDTVNGYASGIIVNQPNSNGRITNLTVQGVNFDYAASSAPTLVQTNAIKTIGTYYNFTVNAPAGRVYNNYFGRCTNVESITDGTGIIYSRNQVASGIENTDSTSYTGKKSTMVQASSSIAYGYEVNLASANRGNVWLNVTGDVLMITRNSTPVGLFLNNTGCLGVLAAPVASAVLSATSTTKGFLPPVMTTTQKNAIASPAEGLMVYDSTLHKLCIRTASAWETITSV